MLVFSAPYTIFSGPKILSLLSSLNNRFPKIISPIDV
jgi:hypothetical protein